MFCQYLRRLGELGNQNFNFAHTLSYSGCVKNSSLGSIACMHNPQKDCEKVKNKYLDKKYWYILTVFQKTG